MPPWTIKTCTGTGGSLTREVPVCVAGEPVKAVMVCCKLAAPLTISGISINDSNYSLSKYLQHRAKWRSLSPAQQLPQTLSATRLGPGNQANCRTSDKVACCKLPIEIVNDKRRYSQHREAARLFDFKCTSGPCHSTLEHYNSVNSDPKKETPDHRGQPRGPVEQPAGAQAR